MSPQEIERFFRNLDRALGEPAAVILTGAAAGSLMGHVRSSVDIDFAIEPKRKRPDSWEKIEAALQRATQATGITAQYARDIDRWGMISLMDYRKNTVPFRKFGQVEVRILRLPYWAIGKFSRFLEPDLQDLVVVLKKSKPDPLELMKTLGKALRASPPSSQRFQFREHVEYFLQKYGRKVWGARFDSGGAVASFHRYARIFS